MGCTPSRADAAAVVERPAEVKLQQNVPKDDSQSDQPKSPAAELPETIVLKDAEDVVDAADVNLEYCGAVVPHNEGDRWNYLCRLGVLDTEPESRFDDITKLCCMVFHCPIALVSLVDKERQWFKSVQGLPVNETDRKSSFCAWTLLPTHPSVLVVENALNDARFKDNKLVTGFPHIRFYAGCPLVTSAGFRLGSLCIIDKKPRTFDAESCNMLANMAEMVVREIEKEKLLELQKQRSAILTKENTQILRAMDCFSEGIILCNMSDSAWPILFANEAWYKVTGVQQREQPGGTLRFWELFKETGESSAAQYNQAIQNLRTFELSVYYESSDGRRIWVQVQFRYAGNEQVDSNMPLIGIPASLELSMVGNPVYYFGVINVQTRASGEQPPSAHVSSFSVMSAEDRPFPDVKLGPLLGKGAYGRVYRGVWNGAQVAVKVIERVDKASSYPSSRMSSSSSIPERSGMFEAGIHEAISHPNVVQTYKHGTFKVARVGNTGQQLCETWMVLEFCNKGSLSDAAERGWFRHPTLTTVNHAAVLQTAAEIAGAMCYLHTAGILHGDLTGNNLLLASSDKDDRGFTCKVADFGLSRVLDTNTDHIETQSYGTVTHMPPELLLEGTMSKAGDVYAFGVVLWEMFNGQRPFSGMAHGQVIHRITTAACPLEFPPDPDPLLQIAKECMERDPAKRLTFPEILERLHALIDQQVQE